MAQITIDIPENELEDSSKEQWEDLIKNAITERKMKELKWKHIKEISSKSQATEKDVEELTEKAMVKHYSQ